VEPGFPDGRRFPIPRPKSKKPRRWRRPRACATAAVLFALRSEQRGVPPCRKPAAAHVFPAGLYVKSPACGRRARSVRGRRDGGTRPGHSGTNPTNFQGTGLTGRAQFRPDHHVVTGSAITRRWISTPRGPPTSSSGRTQDPTDVETASRGPEAAGLPLSLRWACCFLSSCGFFPGSVRRRVTIPATANRNGVPANAWGAILCDVAV